MKEISIIGATSAFGLNLVTLLTEKGYQVFAGYRSENCVPDSWRKNPLINLQKLDLSKQNNFADFCCENVVWLAHLEQGRFNENEIAVNLKPLEDFLNQTENSPIKKIVFVSSGGAVYGEPLFLPITENHPRNPLSSYGKAKRAMEDRIIEFAGQTEIKTSIIRPGNIYGFENSLRENKGIVAVFLNAIQKNIPFNLIHHGRTVRDFIHVSDVSRAVLAAVESNQKEIIWNVATGKGKTSAEILQIILDKSGFAAPMINHHENFSSDVSTNILAIDRIISESDWLPQISIEEGIAQTIKNWQSANAESSAN